MNVLMCDLYMHDVLSVDLYLLYLLLDVLVIPVCHQRTEEADQPLKSALDLTVQVTFFID